MFSLIALVVTGALCRRFAGGGLFGTKIVNNLTRETPIVIDTIKGRKYYAAGLLALVTLLCTSNPLIAGVVFGGFFMNEIMGTSKIFDGMYWDDGRGNFWDSFWYAFFRGSLKVFTSIGISIVTWNPYVAFIGLLGVLDSVWYTVGKLSKKAPSSIAEPLSGAGFGLLIYLST